MSVRPEGTSEAQVRDVIVQVYLAGGHRQELVLREDAPELTELLKVLVNRGSDGASTADQFFQLPVNGGRTACSFSSRQLVALITNPPVVVDVQQAAVPQDTPAEPADAEGLKPDVALDVSPEPVLVHSPNCLVIDDFLSPDEHRDMLALALQEHQRFEKGTVESKESHYRSNRVILDFQEDAHSRLVQNRLLVWLPFLVQGMGLDLFPLETVEIQLTASNHGEFYRRHQDGGAGSKQADSRALTCVYYFFRQPKPFAGGDLLLYDWRRQGEALTAADSFRRIEPLSNRLVVFPSDAFHELMPVRCPSREFADSRFAMTIWLHRAKEPNAEARFGWGHFRCGAVPSGFA
jgi:Rps23 Pro-64 3,4-dihydroxylase Tpa1-like proline 4-hydroxylase